MLDELYRIVHRRLLASPGIVVLLVVLVLLYDVGGAVRVIAQMVAVLLANLVGGGNHEAVASVLWRTLPLALAAAGVTFAACNRWLQFDSLHAYVWMALIVLTGAVVGNACYERCRSAVVVGTTVPMTASTTSPPVRRSALTAATIRQTRSPTRTYPRSVAAVPVPPTAWQRLNNVQWLRKPNLSRRPEPILPLNVVPKGSGIYGSVAAAVNQLLGYLVAYEPRLFLASLVTGSFVGWRIQHKVAAAHVVVTGDFHGNAARETEKRAA